jgi:hypothetical protein
MRRPALYRRLWPRIQRALTIHEASLSADLLHDEHEYALEWRANSLRASIDGGLVMETPSAPHGPCGFIAWIDNQYAIVTPQGRFGFGVVPVPAPCALSLRALRVERLTD